MTRRMLGASLAAGIGGCANSSVHAAPPFAAAPPPSFDPTPYVHQELRPFVGQMLAIARAPLNAETLEATRRTALTYALPSLQQPLWDARRIPGPDGAPDLRIFVVNAQESGAGRPAILHLHGGGFVSGSGKTDIRRLQEIALALNCVIVSVDYRLAPETPYPGPLEDGYAGLSWLFHHAEALGADSARLAVMGESAGGGLAAMLAILARDRREVPLVYQALSYPMLDDRTGSLKRKPAYQGALVWTPEKNAFGWSALLGASAGRSRASRGAVPARMEILEGLPPTFIGVGSIDLFVDEDIDYARRLIDAGVPVTLDVVPGAFHGFDGIPGTRVGQRFRTAVVSALEAVFSPPHEAAPPRPASLA